MTVLIDERNLERTIEWLKSKPYKPAGYRKPIVVPGFERRARGTVGASIKRPCPLCGKPMKYSSTMCGECFRKQPKDWKNAD
jgi:hypothetical protein